MVCAASGRTAAAPPNRLWRAWPACSRRSCPGRPENPLHSEQTGEDEVDTKSHDQQDQGQGGAESPFELRDLLLNEHGDHDVPLTAKQRRRDVEPETKDEDEQAPCRYPRQTEREKDAP